MEMDDIAKTPVFKSDEREWIEHTPTYSVYIDYGLFEDTVYIEMLEREGFDVNAYKVILLTAFGKAIKAVYDKNPDDEARLFKIVYLLWPAGKRGVCSISRLAVKDVSDFMSTRSIYMQCLDHVMKQVHSEL